MSPQNIHFSPICPISSISVAITNYVNSLASSFKRFYDAVSIVQHYAYSAFGKILSIKDGNGNDVTDAPPVKTSFGFTNREHDEETGLMYYRARYYSPEIGRFISEDPDAGVSPIPSSVINKYIYVVNNPLNLDDPTGESWLGDVIAIAAITVAVVATGGIAAGAYATWGAALTASASAVGATAAGSALAAGAISAFQGGDFMENFGRNFKSIFTVSSAALTGSALFHAFAPASWGANGITSIGANTWYQGGIQTSGGGGLTLFASSSYGPGLASHEAAHTVQFIIQAGTISAGNRYGNLGLSRENTLNAAYGMYLATGLVGIPSLGNDGAIW